MNVSNVSTAINLDQAAGAQNSLRKDFRALQSALASGDLSGAQQAFATLQTDKPKLAQALSGSNSTSQTNPVSTAFQSLQSALQSNDLSGAQSAFTSLTQALQSVQKPHQHHHHPKANDATGTGTQASTESSGTASASPSGTINTLA